MRIEKRIFKVIPFPQVAAVINYSACDDTEVHTQRIVSAVRHVESATNRSRSNYKLMVITYIPRNLGWNSTSSFVRPVVDCMKRCGQGVSPQLMSYVQGGS